jgi:ABC-2 type transporter
MNAITDGAAAAERQLTKLRHDPFAMVLTVGAPVVLVIIFGYIFGSAISVPGGGNHREFLIPGLYAFTAANILPSMVAMARDSKRGAVDRFRSMPIARTAIPFGQAAATSVYGLISFARWRPAASPWAGGSTAAWATRWPRSRCSWPSSSPRPGSACTSGWYSAARRRPGRRRSWWSP